MPKSRLYKAPDKMEVLIQHSESAIDSWLPLEYNLQKTCGLGGGALLRITSPDCVKPF